MRYTFQEIVQLTKSINFNSFLHELSNIDTKEREKNYLKAARAEMCSREKKLKNKLDIVRGKRDLQIKEWYSWTLCSGESYNKHYSILLKDLFTHIEQYQQVYGLLADALSKRVFSDICYWRLTRESSALVDAYAVSRNPQYFEPFEMLTDKETFVDCGGYIGDSTEQLLEVTGGVGKVFLYEADGKNIVRAKESLQGKNVIFRNVGVGEKNEALLFSGLGLSSNGFVDTEKGDSCKVDVVAIDEDIPETERITFLKMDIEGMELQALQGAQKHIAKDRPVLAICLYHNPQDVWELPLWIQRVTGAEYRYYMRHYTMYHGETVFYAVPNEKYEER